MKKCTVFILFVFMLTSLNVFSQTEAGRFLAGGSTEISYASVKGTFKYDGETVFESDDNSNSFNFKPAFGYFVAENFAITGSIDFTSETEGDVKANSIIFSPGFRYYVGTSNVRPLFLAEIGAGSQTAMFEGEEVKFNLFGYAVAGGAAIFISEAISFDALLGYASMTSTFKEDTKAKIIASGMAFQAGFTVYF